MQKLLNVKISYNTEWNSSRAKEYSIDRDPTQHLHALSMGAVKWSLPVQAPTAM